MKYSWYQLFSCRRIIVRYIKIIEFKEAYINRLIVIIAILKEGKLGIKQEY